MEELINNMIIEYEMADLGHGNAYNFYFNSKEKNHTYVYLPGCISSLIKFKMHDKNPYFKLYGKTYTIDTLGIDDHIRVKNKITYAYDLYFDLNASTYHRGMEYVDCIIRGEVRTVYSSFVNCIFEK